MLSIVSVLGAIGGILAIGAAGLILGPAIISVTLALIKILKKRINGKSGSTEGD